MTNVMEVAADHVAEGDSFIDADDEIKPLTPVARLTSEALATVPHTPRCFFINFFSVVFDDKLNERARRVPETGSWRSLICCFSVVFVDNLIYHQTYISAEMISDFTGAVYFFE